MMGPFAARWLDGVFVPVPYYVEECKRSFDDGTLYHLEEVKSRSQSSHNHFFAEVTDAWRNLPEIYADKFGSAEHLRKWALIVSGWHTQNVIAFANASEAVAAVSLFKDMDEYAVTEVNENVVTVYRAKSQSRKAMGARDFQQSKDDCLREIARLLSVSVGEIKENAEAAA